MGASERCHRPAYALGHRPPRYHISDAGTPAELINDRSILMKEAVADAAEHILIAY